MLLSYMEIEIQGYSKKNLLSTIQIIFLAATSPPQNISSSQSSLTRNS